MVKSLQETLPEMAAVTFPPLISIIPVPLWNSWQTLPVDDAARIQNPRRLEIQLVRLRSVWWFSCRVFLNFFASVLKV